MIPLEDLSNDVLGKAQRGLKISDATLAEQAGISVTALAALKDGGTDEADLLKVAPCLQLHGPSLVTMAKMAWHPQPVQMGGLAQFNTTYHDMTVNAYITWDPATRAAVAFDTGADAQPMIDFLSANDLSLSMIFLTHTHGDHVADLEKLCATTGCKTVRSHEREAQPGTQTFAIAPDTAWNVGGLRIIPRSTWGHSAGGVTYVVSGLQQPVAIVGDALFASSMGGGAVSYADALATNRKEIFTLPDNTIICPGHGPFTTVEQEKANNPFYPEFK
ncbi:MAG: MBL fold metallo-hydrolase [Verrucomicrobiales bacterium]|nr:MBL fold metallo-hydrolase [Verrucomicrobiales bacterium]MCP5558432.1 MBL fold metallo-hydrolase [Verrucomicrobiaceae bacterium]